jgi:6-phosphogluconate dehydrogenase
MMEEKENPLSRLTMVEKHLESNNCSLKSTVISTNKISGDIGLIGLAVMGQNLILNAADNGYTVVAYNRTVSKVDHFLENEAKGKSIIGAHSIEELCANLKRPRRIILLVKAGKPVDDFIESLLPHLEKGDIIIDGGNSHFPDSNRRCTDLEKKGILFVGSGVSGGEEGARYGPSLMPGGHPDAWPHIKEIFQSIAAKSDGEPCCDWVGEGGAGHYVKMVHNGIEYGDMQLICEAYDLMKRVGKFSNKEIGDVFTQWNKGVLDSFLIEITRDIMYFNDPTDGKPLLEKILDSAGQKGTGKWTAINALDLGMPVTLIGEAVFARCLSALKSERVRASSLLTGPSIEDSPITDKKKFVDDLEQALYASKIISYAQGFMLIREAAKEYGWKLNNPAIALMWRGGCIIRSVFLGEITAAYREKPDLENLLFHPFFNEAITKAQKGWRSTISKAVEAGIPVPAFSTALSFYDGYRSEKLPANLLQAQRDYFGAHTFKVLPGLENDFVHGDWIHVNWTGKGGNVSASTYDA